MATTKTGIEVSERPNRYYESIIILHPDVKEDDQKAFFKKNVDTIKNYNGDLHHLDTWGRRKLANPIKKSRTGTYFHSSFEANADCVTELERMMKIDDRVLRYMHTRLDERKSLSEHLDRFKSALAEANKREQEREAKRDMRRRDDRGGRGGDRGDRGDRGGRGGDREGFRGPRRDTRDHRDSRDDAPSSDYKKSEE